MNEALEATDQAADLTRNMLSFARRASLTPKRLDLNAVVRTNQSWAARVPPAPIRVESSLPAGLWQIEADPGSTESALLNLIVTARDAMPNGRSPAIETANVRVDQVYLVTRGEDLPQGRYVMLAVTDTGSGITQDGLKLIFEPFYNAKPPGEGTELGLSAVQGVLRQSGGMVQVYSEPGPGTTFKLYFLALDGDYPDLLQEVPQTQSRRDSQARVLVVEDAADLMTRLVVTLNKAGFDVRPAATGDQALAF